MSIIRIRDNEGNIIEIPTLSGKDGITPIISLGKVETLAAGSKAIVTLDGTAENLVLNFGIPKGADGSTPALSIGAVTTLAAGNQATASISGTAEKTVLNLGIPKGANGKDGTDGLDGGEETYELIGSYDISGGTVDVSFASLKKIAVYFSIPAGYSGSTMSVLVYMTTNSANEPALCHGHSVATYKKPIGCRIDVEGRPWYSVKSVVTVGDSNTADSVDPYALATSQFAETIAPYHISTPIQRLKLVLTGGTLPSGSTVLLCGVKA